MKVGFIGLGLMGNLMAKNILKSGFPLTVYNRTRSKTNELKNLGAHIAESPKDLAKWADLIITMVTGPKDVERIIFGQNSITSTGRSGLVVVDMSTIGTTAAKMIAKKLSPFGIEFLDAPVTGSTPKAETGELTIFIGGKEKIYRKVKPILLAVGKNLNYLGPVGSGQAFKLANNLLGATGTQALAEAILLTKSLGLPKRDVARVLAEIPALSPMAKMNLPNLINGSFPLRFSLSNMSKDLSLALAEAQEAKIKLPLLETSEKVFRGAKKSDLAGKDFSTIINHLSAK